MDLSDISRPSGMHSIRRLSNALRRGTLLRPQTGGRLFKDGGSCALGAIYEATFYRADGHYFSMLESLLQAYPELENEWCDVETRSVRVLIREIYKRNDTGHRREEIAGWLEGLGY